MLEDKLARLELRDLKPKVGVADVQHLLGALVGWRDDEAQNRAALERATLAYRRDAGLSLYGVRRGEMLAGLIGLEAASKPEIVIRHIVVHPAHQGKGIGRALIGAVWEMQRPARLVAETDATAVGFYRRCGFRVASLGEVYPGTERFRCVLERWETT